MAESLYDILGVNKTSSKEEIKKAYRNLSKQHHPDVGGDEETFKKIDSAYEILSDDEKRKNYDVSGDPNARRRPFSNPFNNPFTNPFGNQRPRIRPIVVKLNLSVEEVFNGTIRNVAYNIEKNCNVCNGRGATEVKTCETCQGKGAKVEFFQNMQHISMCPSCAGSGVLMVKQCGSCHGRGKNLQHQSHEIKIPKGSVEGNILIMEGFGHDLNVGKGDVHVVVEVEPHPTYRLEGLNLHQKEEVSFVDMVLGSDYELKTLSGVFKIKIPENCESDRIFRLKNQGVQDENTGITGDLYVRILPKIPKNLSQEEKDALLTLKNLSPAFS